MLKTITCTICADSLLEKKNLNAYYLSLTQLKDNGGLIYPSIDVFKVIKVCELVFKGGVSGMDPEAPQISAVKKIKNILSAKIIRELPCKLFQSLHYHNDENEILNENLHVTQITKEIVNLYLDLRLFRYGQQYTEMVLKKGSLGMRQKVNKLVLFKGL